MTDLTNLYLAIVLAFVGFLTLAFILLYPVYRFLQQEDKTAKVWTARQRAERLHTPPPSGDGAPSATEDPPTLKAG